MAIFHSYVCLPEGKPIIFGDLTILYRHLHQIISSFTAKYGKIGGGKPVNEHLNPDATDATPKKSDLSQP